MTENQKKRFNDDLVKIAGCKVNFIRDHGVCGWDAGFENELGARRVAWQWKNVDGFSLDFSKNLNMWTVGVVK